MAQRVAERHAARVKAIEEAQEAQRREEEAARAAAVQTAAADAAASAVAPQPNDTIESDDFHFPSDDDTFYANVDMDALDEGVGRPIDYDEGTCSTVEADSPGGVSFGSMPVSDATGASAPGRAVQQPPRLPQPAQQRTRALSSGPTNSGTRQQASHQNQNVPPAYPPLQYAKPGSSGERPRTPSMGGGFSFPTGQQGAPPNRAPGQMPSRGGAAATTSSSGVGQKRTADIMQGIHAGLAQARRSQQGMGLHNPPTSSGSGSSVSAAGRREPFAALELGGGGDVKRPRRG
ncbi:hypothetical protein C8Q74DRAFT_1319451 [Fomes fomentarius]|nr:hypothetical protein C8Q74DRAFT_1319451 [Fomes fomentarius]